MDTLFRQDDRSLVSRLVSLEEGSVSEADMRAALRELEKEVHAALELRTKSHIDGLVTRLEVLEKSKASPDSSLAAIHTDAAVSQQEYDSLAQRMGDQVNNVKTEVEKQCDSLRMQVEVLDSYLRNLSTKELADKIIEFMQPYAPTATLDSKVRDLERRVTMMEHKASQLRHTGPGHDEQASKKRKISAREPGMSVLNGSH
jgi:chromosome segregation ATPase